MRPGTIKRFPLQKLVAAVVALGLHAVILAMVLTAPVSEVALGRSDALDIQFVELGMDMGPGDEAGAEVDVVPDPVIEPGPEPTAVTEPEPNPEPEPAPESELVVEEPEPEAIAEDPPPPEPQLKPEPKPKSEPKPQPKPKPKPRTEPKPKPEPKTQPEPQAESWQKPQQQVQTKEQQAFAQAAPAPVGEDAQTSPSLGDPRAVEPERPRTVGQVDYMGRRPQPVYPRMSERRREQGRVVLRVLISPKGEVAEVQVQKSSGYKRLDQAALDAMRQARFRPYTENGIAYKALVDIPFDFVL